MALRCPTSEKTPLHRGGISTYPLDYCLANINKTPWHMPPTRPASGFRDTLIETSSLLEANRNPPQRWSQYTYALRPGPFRYLSRRRQLTDDLIVHRGGLSAGSRMVAQLDADVLHLGIYKLSAGRFIHVEGAWDDLGAITLGGGLWEVVVDADSDGVMLLVQGEIGRRLLRLAREVAMDIAGQPLASNDSLVLPPSKATRHLAELLDEALASTDAARVAAIAAELPHAVESLLPKIQPLAALLPKPRSQRRLMALQYEQRIWDALPLRGSMPDVDRETCDALGLTRRTLQLAVQEHFGMSSNALQRTIRLSYANLLLSDPEGARNVTDAALAAGFSHLGRFSQQYRALFGETPSRTLAATTG